MRGRGGAPRFDRPSTRSATLRKSLAVTLSIAALIVVLAFAIVGVLAAVSGQQSGLDKSRCAAPSCATDR
jgi:hypothetical protein